MEIVNSLTLNFALFVLLKEEKRGGKHHSGSINIMGLTL